MSKIQTLSDRLRKTFGDKLNSNVVKHGEVTIEVDPENLIEVCTALRDDKQFAFEEIMDVCGIDYSEYGCTEWATEDSTSSGFSRGVEATASARLKFGDAPRYINTERPRFAAVHHLLSISNNWRLRVRCYCQDEKIPMVPTVVGIWVSANWYEREAFDLYGIIFEGHPDLRRILTDYGFVGHPFRKDFPLVGHVEMRYDEEQKRVVYQPVSIDPRVLVPRVIRDDNRYVEGDNDSGDKEQADA